VSPRLAYLRLLGAPTVTALAQQTFRTIVTALERGNSFAPPIRLHRVASQFMVRPDPIFDEHVEDGGITFNAVDRQFVITLQRMRSVVGSDESRSSRRLRFTYAHEFVHRFFFVLDGEEWIRAANRASQRFVGLERLKATRLLHGLEERLCNRLAGALLVPPRLLESFGAGQMRTCDLRDGVKVASSFEALLQAGTSHFEVSRECFFRQLARSKLREGFPSTFCAFIVRPDIRRGTAPHGPLQLRVIDSLISSRCSVFPARVYPGFPCAQFGPNAAEVIQRLFSSPATRAGQVRLMLDCPESLQGDLAETAAPHHAVLNGFWRRWQHDASGNKTVLLFGNLEARSADGDKASEIVSLAESARMVM
jgi:Zn-dependent peptidase ImmA (M78 family)